MFMAGQGRQDRHSAARVAPGAPGGQAGPVRHPQAPVRLPSRRGDQGRAAGQSRQGGRPFRAGAAHQQEAVRRRRRSRAARTGTRGRAVRARALRRRRLAGHRHAHRVRGALRGPRRGQPRGVRGAADRRAHQDRPRVGRRGKHRRRDRAAPRGRRHVPEGARRRPGGAGHRPGQGALPPRPLPACHRTRRRRARRDGDRARTRPRRARAAGSRSSRGNPAGSSRHPVTCNSPRRTWRPPPSGR